VISSNMGMILLSISRRGFRDLNLALLSASSPSSGASNGSPTNSFHFPRSRCRYVNHIHYAEHQPKIFWPISWTLFYIFHNERSERPRTTACPPISTQNSVRHGLSYILQNVLVFPPSVSQSSFILCCHSVI
jgi:hypothetical protein